VLFGYSLVLFFLGVCFVFWLLIVHGSFGRGLRICTCFFFGIVFGWGLDRFVLGLALRRREHW